MPLLPLLTLTLAAFSIGTSEFVIQGLLPEISADLSVSIPKAGLLVTAFALGIAIGGPLLAIPTGPLPRKTSLLGLMAVFVAGHVLCAVAPDYTFLMIARVAASCTVGTFFGIGSVVAAAVVPQDRRASAVALMWAGIAAANIFGVPAGTALGQVFGWRSTFWGVAALGAMASAAIAMWLPDTGSGGQTSFVSQLKVLSRPQVLIALALSVLICAGTFSVFTYIAPLLIGTTGISPTALPIYLLLFGVSGVIGMQAGGHFADRNPIASIIGAFGALVVLYLVQLLAFRSVVPATVMMLWWGFAFYFPATAIQLRVINAAREAPNLASTLIHSGFNLGNAIGPVVGAAALSAGFSYSMLPGFGAALALIGVVISLWSAALDHQTTVART